MTVADAKSGVSHVAIAPDGKSALVSRDGDDRISVLSIDGTKVEYTKRDLNAGLRPYGLDIASTGGVAVVANIGRGGGDNDTVSVIDLQARPPRVVDTFTVGQTPEGIKLSPDGKLCGVVVMNGSNKAKDSPFFSDAGKLLLYRVDGTRLTKLAEAPIGHWSQGVAFAPDNRTILVGNMVEKDVQVLRGTTSPEGYGRAHQGERRLRRPAHRGQAVRAVSPLASCLAGAAAETSFRRRRLGRTPVLLPPRDRAWRRSRRASTRRSPSPRRASPFPRRWTAATTACPIRSACPTPSPRASPSTSPRRIRCCHVPPAHGGAPRGLPWPRPRAVLLPLSRGRAGAGGARPPPRRGGGRLLATARGPPPRDHRPPGAARHARGPTAARGRAGR